MELAALTSYPTFVDVRSFFGTPMVWPIARRYLLLAWALTFLPHDPEKPATVLVAVNAEPAVPAAALTASVRGGRGELGSGRKDGLLRSNKRMVVTPVSSTLPESGIQSVWHPAKRRMTSRTSPQPAPQPGRRACPELTAWVGHSSATGKDGFITSGSGTALGADSLQSQVFSGAR